MRCSPGAAMADAGAVRLRRGDLYPPGAVAAVLACGGLPLYIHAPRYFAEEMGIALPVLGAVLLAARGIDSVQDPIIGRLADRWSHYREIWVLVSGALLVTGLCLLFGPAGWGAPLPRLALGLLIAFTGFSALQIALYDHGLAQAEAAGGGYTRIALWREAGGLVGICLAALAPAVAAGILGAPYAHAGFALAFALFAVLILGRMRGSWRSSGQGLPRAGLADALRVPGVGAILVFGLVNALPTAITSTLFLFFVADVLVAEPHAGIMLVVFFAAAASAAPAWAKLAGRIGRKLTLMAGMAISIPVFVWAYVLGPGDTAAFYVIVIASGAALGADMTLAPAMLAARIRGGGGQVFAIWTFLQKTALAVAAGVALPALALMGYEPGTSLDDGRKALAVAYALVPCALKLVAIAVLLAWVKDRGDQV